MKRFFPKNEPIFQFSGKVIPITNQRTDSHIGRGHGRATGRREAVPSQEGGQGQIFGPNMA